MLLCIISLIFGEARWAPNLRVEDVFGDLPVLQTERLRLRRLRLDDAGDMFEYASDPEVSRYTTWEAHKTLEDSRAFLASVIEQYNTFQVAPWGMEHKRDRKLVGTCGFLRHHMFVKGEYVDLKMYSIVRSEWGP